MRKLESSWWWDATWNPAGGCLAVSPGCANCYAAQIAGTYEWPAGEKALHHGTTVKRGTRRVFNGKMSVLPPGHPGWTWPLRWPGAKNPCLGPGMPSLIFVGDMSDIFIETRPATHIGGAVSTIAMSEHVGLFLTKRAGRMADYFLAQNPRTVRRWQPKMWLGFSAERQAELDQRWGDMSQLALAGWPVFVSVAPMLDPVHLPPDLLALGGRAWVIVAGEQGAHKHCRDMRPEWARRLRDQCVAAGVPFFMKQMARGRPVPPDLQIRQFPVINPPRYR